MSWLLLKLIYSSNCGAGGKTFQEFPILPSNKNLLCRVTMEMTRRTMTLSLSSPSNNLLFHSKRQRPPAALNAYITGLQLQSSSSPSRCSQTDPQHFERRNPIMIKVERYSQGRLSIRQEEVLSLCADPLPAPRARGTCSDQRG